MLTCRTWTGWTCKHLSPGNVQCFLSSLSPATISRRPASAPWRAAHQLSFVNQCTTALFLMPFPPLPSARPDETNQSVPDPFTPQSPPPPYPLINYLLPESHPHPHSTITLTNTTLTRKPVT